MVANASSQNVGVVFDPPVFEEKGEAYQQEEEGEAARVVASDRHVYESGEGEAGAEESSQEWPIHRM